MKQNNYKPQLPDVMEAIFDAAYLIFDLVAAILFFIYSKGDMLFILYGILTLTLCGEMHFILCQELSEQYVEVVIRKETARNWITDIIYYNDSFLYYSDVYLEIYISRVYNTSNN